MAGLQVPAALMLLGLSVAFLLVSPSHSLTCTSQTFTNSKLYANCTDLPTLGAFLHWTYQPTNSSLSIAFFAPPAKADGWIAWAINPTGTGMAGAQALIAFKQTNGSMGVKTFNISSYGSIVPSNLSFAVSGEKAEHSAGLMRIFATLTLPANTTSVNQVWQVGGSVTNGAPDKHEFNTANLNAKGKLDLVSSAAEGGAPAAAPGSSPSGGSPATSPAPNPASANSPAGGQGGTGNGAISRSGNSKFGVFILLFLASFVLCF